jgi:microcin-processing metallopeptidase PmbA/TldD-like protein
MMRSFLRSGALGILSLCVAMAASAQDDVLRRALRDELTRSIKELKLGQLATPYFIAYRANEHQGLSASAMNGSLLSSNEFRGRSFFPEVRVGDYGFDNTNFTESSGALVAIGFGRGDGMSLEFGGLPLDDNYLELRRQVWLLTDVMYKAAAEAYASKRAALLNRSQRDTLPDFRHATPVQIVDTTPPVIFARADAEALVRSLSAIPELARLDHSSVDFAVGNSRRILLNTEGTNTLTSTRIVSISASGETHAADGAPLAASVHVYARSADKLPSREQLIGAIRTMAMRLDSLRNAPILDRYSGPVLFEGRAAGELFARVFAPALVGRRRSEGASNFVAMMGMMGQMGQSMTSFTDRLGSRVLPTFLSVSDDPTISSSEGRELLGGYRVDDDGVPAERTLLVDHGIVKQLLTTRNPIAGVPASTGNRRGEDAAPSNMLVTTTDAVSEVELRAHLLALVKERGLPYGLIVRELGIGAVQRDDPRAIFAMIQGRAAGESVLLAYRVYADGREELVRGARLTDLSAQSFRDLVAVSNSETVFHRPAMTSSFPLPLEVMDEIEEVGGASMPIASYVVPSLLFEDLTVERAQGEPPKPPLSPPPGSASR